MLLFSGNCVMRGDRCTKHDKARGHSEANGGDVRAAREAQPGTSLLLPGVAFTGWACACFSRPVPTPQRLPPSRRRQASQHSLRRLPPIMGRPVRSSRSPGSLMGRASPRVAMTAPYRCGTRERVVDSCSTPGIPARSTPWPGRPMAGTLHRGVMTARCRCGTR